MLKILYENEFDSKIIKCCSYNITFNHSSMHDLIKKLKERNINLSIDELLIKLRKGLKKAVEYAIANNRKEVALYFNKSKFITILRITKKLKDIYIKTFLAYDMKVKNINLRIDLNELKESFNIEENTFYNFDYGFIEPDDALYIDEWIEINE